MLLEHARPQACRHDGGHRPGAVIGQPDRHGPAMGHLRDRGQIHLRRLCRVRAVAAQEHDPAIPTVEGCLHGVVDLLGGGHARRDDQRATRGRRVPDQLEVQAARRMRSCALADRTARGSRPRSDQRAWRSRRARAKQPDRRAVHATPTGSAPRHTGRGACVPSQRVPARRRREEPDRSRVMPSGV